MCQCTLKRRGRQYKEAEGCPITFVSLLMSELLLQIYAKFVFTRGFSPTANIISVTLIAIATAAPERLGVLMIPTRQTMTLCPSRARMKVDLSNLLEQRPLLSLPLSLL